ncbi:MAG: hypothetical protein KDA78_03025 [Planctomycetaceae bacterium]|nr:hypothetical protein [Planctomycetaceae bacterium]
MHTPEPVPAETKPGDETPAEVPTTPPATNEDPFEPITNNFNNVQTAQASSTQSSAAPNMIGDFLPAPFGVSLGNPLGPILPYSPSTYAPAAGGTRLQIGQNNSPLPRDRFAVTYNHFHNAYQMQTSTGELTDAHLDLYTSQFEKTFNDGRSSVELRIPVYSAPNNTQTLEVGNDDVDGYSMEFGNISMIMKRVLIQDCRNSFVVTTGMGLTIPTGPDSRFIGDPTIPATNSITVRNQALSLTPYVATLFRPSDRVFSQFFMQADFALNGNDFNYTNGATVVNGDLNDQHILKFDWQTGIWLMAPPCGGCTDCCGYDSCCDSGCCGLGGGGGGMIRNIAAIFELHYATTMNNADLITVTDPGLTGPVNFGNGYNRVDVLNATVGCTTLVGSQGALTTAISLPLNEISDNVRAFDHELILQYNHYLFPAR